MSLLILRILVAAGGVTFLGIGLRYLSLGGRIAGGNVAASKLTDSNIPSPAVKPTAFYITIPVIFTVGLVRLLALIGRRIFDREVLLASIPEVVFLPRRSIA